MAERLVRTIKTLLTARIEEIPGQWDERIDVTVLKCRKYVPDPGRKLSDSFFLLQSVKLM